MSKSSYVNKNTNNINKITMSVRIIFKEKNFRVKDINITILSIFSVTVLYYISKPQISSLTHMPFFYREFENITLLVFIDLYHQALTVPLISSPFDVLSLLLSITHPRYCDSIYFVIQAFF